MRCGFVTACVLLAARASSYKWAIDETYHEDKLSFSELYMYGSDAGPWPLTGGEAYVSLELAATIRGAGLGHGATFNVSVAFFTAESELRLADVDVCRESLPVDARHVERHTFETVGSEGGGMRARLDVRYSVVSSGLQYVVMQSCSTSGLHVSSAAATTVSLEGSIAFKNPYGFLPGMYFGFLPFEGARALGSSLFQLGFVILLIWHRDKLLPLHYAICCVSLVATAEACLWFASYLSLNLTGQPLCCPFVPTVVASMTLEIARRTASRLLLLVVSLGFGLVRSSLTRKETVLVVVLTVGYLVSSIVATTKKIQATSGLHSSNPRQSSVWLEMPVLLFDLIFLVWIYVALINMTDQLKASGQTYKLSMYTQLANTIAVFVALVSGLTAVIFVAKLGFFEWPWQFYWAQTVGLEFLNFAIIAAVCCIWRPTERSKMLAEMTQLSTSDDTGSGLEMAQADEADADDQCDQA